jgi:hypothetical protein
MAKPVDPVPEDTKYTRLQAQIKLGLFAPHDWLMLCLVFVSVFSIGVLALFGQLTWQRAEVLLLASCLFTLAWLIVLVYRCLVFILDAHADIQLLPEAAARLAVGYFEGRPKK